MSAQSYSLYSMLNGAVTPHQLTFWVKDHSILEWRSDAGVEAQPLSEILEIRLWVVTRKLGSMSGKAELLFADGTRLRITSTTINGAKDAVRDKEYKSLIGEIHSAIPTEQRAKIVFRRGLANGSPAKGWTAFVICAAVDVALIFFLWTSMRDDAQWFVRPALIVFGLAGLVLAANVGQMIAGRTYDPNSLPNDLFPS